MTHTHSRAEPSAGARESRRRDLPSPLRFHHLLDARMSRGNQDQLVDRVMEWTRQGGLHITVGVNAHVVNLARSDGDFAAQLAQADLMHADGQSVVWGARALGVRLAERVSTTDLAPKVVQRAASEGDCIYFLGGEPGVAEEAAARMRSRFPGTVIHAHHGYLDARGTEVVLAELAECRPAVLFVGMGDPLQLRWILDHREHLHDVVAITSGGLFDWLSERNRRAPQWMIRLGLEWLHRLFIEPGRLWRRYVIGNPRFVLEVMRSARSLRRAGSASAKAGRPGA